MIDRPRNKLLTFIESDKDAPILSGFAVGVYMMLFYYARNFALANSWNQFLFFTGYYLVLPCLVLFAGHKILKWLKLAAYRKYFLFIGTAGFFAFFLIQLSEFGENKKFIFAAVMLAIALLSLKIARYYKAFIPLLLLISLFNVKPVAGVAYKWVTASDEWKTIHDDLEKITFKSRPNVYYIQPDGYTSFCNLRENPNCRFDVGEYAKFLSDSGFTLYDNYRSNYCSTLLSNSATFAMKHHYIAKDVESYSARSIITEDNPVLRIFKNNGYRTSFITEKAYLVMNRPVGGFDYCNIKNDELPYLKDGLDMEKDIFTDLKTQMKKNRPTGNFYFVEKFDPSHITNYPDNSTGIEGEKKIYFAGIKKVNLWLTQVVNYIDAKDPDAIIIIGADHGGFTGLTCTAESTRKIRDKELIYSIFGAQLAIKWNSPEAARYDKNLKTGVNLFRVLFSFLGRESKYLNNLEADDSYIHLKDPTGIYRYVNSSGHVVFEGV